MALLNRKSLLKKEDLDIKKVNLNKEDFVFVRQMTGRERDSFEQSIMEIKQDGKGNQTVRQNLKDFRAKLIVHTVCDEDGKNILETKDFETLSKNMSAATLEKLVNEAQKLNGMSQNDVDDLVKN